MYFSDVGPAWCPGWCDGDGVSDTASQPGVVSGRQSQCLHPESYCEAEPAVSQSACRATLDCTARQAVGTQWQSGEQDARYEIQELQEILGDRRYEEILDTR